MDRHSKLLVTGGNPTGLERCDQCQFWKPMKYGVPADSLGSCEWRLGPNNDWMPRAWPVELYYSVAQLEVLLCRSDRTIREQLRRGDFGRDVIEDGCGFLVPASGVNAYLDQHRLFPSPTTLAPVAAISEGQARRRSRARSNPQPESAHHQAADVIG